MHSSFPRRSRGKHGGTSNVPSLISTLPFEIRSPRVSFDRKIVRLDFSKKKKRSRSRELCSLFQLLFRLLLERWSRIVQEICPPSSDFYCRWSLSRTGTNSWHLKTKSTLTRPTFRRLFSITRWNLVPTETRPLIGALKEKAAGLSVIDGTVIWRL